MSKHKSAKNALIKPWLSGKIDCQEGRFIQVGNSFLLADQVKALSGNELKTYLALSMESGGKPWASLSSTAGAKKYGISESTFRRSIQGLEEKGFISCVFEDNPYRYKTNVYRFTFGWKTDSRSSK